MSMLSYRSTVAARYGTRILERADLFLLQKVYPVFCSEGTWSSFPRPKRPGRERDRSLPFSADVKNVWSRTFSSPYAFRPCGGTTLPCLLYDTFCCRDWFFIVDVMIHIAKFLYCFRFCLFTCIYVCVECNSCCKLEISSVVKILIQGSPKHNQLPGCTIS